MARTLLPGNEPEFYIPHDELPDIHLADVKLSPDSEYLSITGANALTYIYRRKPDGSGFYKLDWSCQHQRLAKSVINFIGFGEHDIEYKHIVCPSNTGLIHQYEILEDDTVEFRSALDISDCKYHCIHWLQCNIMPLRDAIKCYLNIFTIGSHPIKDEVLSPMAEYYSNRKIMLTDYKHLLNNETHPYIANYGCPMMPTKDVYHSFGYIYITSYRYESSSIIIFCIVTGIYTNYTNSMPQYDDCTRIKFTNCDQSYAINYNNKYLWQYKNNKVPFCDGVREVIEEVKGAYDNYIIQVYSNDGVKLYKGDETLKTFIGFRHYKQTDTSTLVNFFTLRNPYTNYVITHEKDKNTKQLQLGFILNISESEKTELQAQRLTDTVTQLTNVNEIPPELINIIQSYL